jgi:hypothetical protein
MMDSGRISKEIDCDELVEILTPLRWRGGALQIVEFGHLIHPCAESAAELARCNALPGLHTPETPMPEGAVLYSLPVTATVTASTSISIGTFTSPFGGV